MREVKRISDHSDEEKEIYKKVKELALTHKKKTGYMPQYSLLLKISVFKKDVAESQESYDYFIKQYKTFGCGVTKKSLFLLMEKQKD